jgi:hypothetical protein
VDVEVGAATPRSGSRVISAGILVGSGSGVATSGVVSLVGSASGLFEQANKKRKSTNVGKIFLYSMIFLLYDENKAQFYQLFIPTILSFL